MTIIFTKEELLELKEKQINNLCKYYGVDGTMPYDELIDALLLKINVVRPGENLVDGEEKRYSARVQRIMEAQKDGRN